MIANITISVPRETNPYHQNATNWPHYSKNNPHIKKNSDTGEYFCTTCERNLSANAGAAGKHCSKIHGINLAGNPRQATIPREEKDDSLKEIKILLTELLSEMKNPKVTEKKKLWYEDIPDYDEKIYEQVEKMTAVASAIRYAKIQGVPESMLSKYFAHDDSKDKGGGTPKEIPFDTHRYFLYKTLAEKHPELANLLLHSLVIDEIKRR